MPDEKQERPGRQTGVLGYGDIWTYTALDADSKLLICWRVGHRDEATTNEFIYDLSLRIRNRGRYSPSRFVSAELKAILGEPDPDYISTSYVKRQNLNIRMECRRMTRLTNAFSRKLANHGYQLAINFAHHNFSRIHRTLRCTPAMAAGVTSSVWSIADLVRIADEYEMTRDWPLAHVS